MKPTLREFIIASPYTLPFWVLAILFLYDRISKEWETVEPVMQLVLVAALGIWVLGTLRVLPKVWWYHYQKYKLARAGRNPEERKQLYKNRQRELLKFIALGAWGYSLWWMSEHSYAENPDYYLAALVIGGGLSFLAIIALYSGLPLSVRKLVRKSISKEEKPFLVQWCQPVPKRTATIAEISAGLPEYCKFALSLEKAHLKLGVSNTQPESGEVIYR